MRQAKKKVISPRKSIRYFSFISFLGTSRESFFLRISVFLIFILVFIGFVVYFMFFFKDYRVRVVGNKIISESSIKEFLNEKYLGKPYFYVHLSDIERDILMNFEYIREAEVYRSIWGGYFIKIYEYEPQAYVAVGSEYYILNYDKFVKINNKDLNLPVLWGDLSLIDDIRSNNKTVHKYAIKSLEVYNELEKINMKSFFDEAIYFFDNFGNLLVKLENNSAVRFDLNEFFYNVRDQVKFVIEVMKEHDNFKEIDVRFKYLIVKLD